MNSPSATEGLFFIAIDYSAIISYYQISCYLLRYGGVVMSNPKVYVGVYASVDVDGRMIPRKVVWEDGTEYEIDKITDIRQAAAMKAGGQGDRYTISVRGQRSYLFYERSAIHAVNNIGRWFVERR